MTESKGNDTAAPDVGLTTWWPLDGTAYQILPPAYIAEGPGHPYFYELLGRIRALHDAKNTDYAKGGKPTGNFDRVGEIVSRYPFFRSGRRPALAVAMTYMLKQLDAALWLLSTDEKSVTGEGFESRMIDVAVYALIECVLFKEGGSSA